MVIEQLEAFGLSSYAARTFAALVSLGEGTAQDVSDVSDVPRTRVYDAVDELRKRGLVDVQQSTPKRFWAISSETSGRLFEREFSDRVERMVEALNSIEPVQRREEQRGVWTVTGRDAVTARVTDFVEDADEEVVYMSVEELLTGEIVDHLRAANDRGVRIKLGGMSNAVEEGINESVPEADVFDSLWNWSDMPAGRLLMVDEERTLVSVLVEGPGDHPPEARDETAIWGSGATNGLVVVLKALFTWQLDGHRE